MRFLRQFAALALTSIVTCFAADLARAAEPAAKSEARTYEQQVTAGLNYLRTKGQAADGSFSAASGPAVTAVVTLGILRNGRSPDEPFVAKALKYLEGFVHEDGGIYGPGHHQNYETCVALECFKAANADERYDKLLKNADAYLRGLQWDSTKGVDAANVKFGGAGYGGENSRPDLSNTSFLIDAPQGLRRQRRRRSHQKGPGLHLALPEPGDRGQHHPLCQQESRRRLLLHAGRGRQ